MRFFEDELIERICTLKEHTPRGDKFLGIDVARRGGDETALASLDRIKRKKLKQFDLDISENTYLTETTRLILHKDKQFNYKKIYIDDGGLGVGVFDPLLEHPQTKRKIVGINNASRPIEKDKRRKKLLKEDLYNNLKNLMENNQIELFDSPELKQSLRSIQYEYHDKKSLKIYGNYSHIAEAIIRAAWCIKDKTLNIYIY